MPEEKLSPLNETPSGGLSANLLGLPAGELREYVHRRLAGGNVPPSLDSKAGEEPEDVLIRLYHEGGTEFKSALANIMAEICWRAQREHVPNDFFSRLLHMVEKIKPLAVRPYLLAILDSADPYFRETKGIYKRDLLLHVMVALQSLPQHRTSVVLWENYLDDPAYTVPAFTGLINEAAHQGVEFLLGPFQRFLLTAYTHSNEINIRPSLIHLVHRFPNEDVVRRLFQECRSAPRKVREYLLSVFMGIPSTARVAAASRSILLPEAHDIQVRRVSHKAAGDEYQRIQEMTSCMVGTRF
ncbi:MAG: hypothetical protein ABSD58_12765 [Verrucomicrobiia bacterium]|jgi:hypothetical protein